MSSIREIKQRINVIQNIENVTDAIQKIAAARLNKARNRAVNLKKYIIECEKIAGILKENFSDSIYYAQRPVKESCCIIITGDKGLCGGFYSRLYGYAEELFRGKNKEKINLIVFGRKGVNHFNKLNYRILLNRVNIPSDFKKSFINEIADNITEMFLNNRIQEVNVIFNDFISVTNYNPTLKRVLPLELNENTMIKNTGMYIFEPASKEIFGSFIAKYIQTLIYNSLVQSYASEQSSRMIMMERSSVSANDMIQDLVKQRNKNRQAGITKELSEIVGTVNALDNA